MAMPAQAPTPIGRTDWTAEMARALPDDGKRYEVLDGELFVTPAPSADHQEALSVLFRLLDPYVREHRTGHLWWSPADIEFSPRRLVQPDLFMAPLIEGKRPRNWGEHPRLGFGGRDVVAEEGASGSPGEEPDLYG